MNGMHRLRGLPLNGKDPVAKVGDKKIGALSQPREVAPETSLEQGAKESWKRGAMYTPESSLRVEYSGQ